VKLLWFLIFLVVGVNAYAEERCYDVSGISTCGKNVTGYVYHDMSYRSVYGEVTFKDGYADILGEIISKNRIKANDDDNCEYLLYIDNLCQDELIFDDKAADKAAEKQMLETVEKEIQEVFRKKNMK
jgi:hypothetical protein